jgi:hypothetical protein
MLLFFYLFFVCCLYVFVLREKNRKSKKFLTFFLRCDIMDFN